MYKLIPSAEWIDEVAWEAMVRRLIIKACVLVSFFIRELTTSSFQFLFFFGK